MLSIAKTVLCAFLLLFNLIPVNGDCKTYVQLTKDENFVEALKQSKKRISITSVIDLGGNSVVIGNGSVLVFKKEGCIKNGTIDVRNATIKTSKESIFENCIVKYKKLKASWFNNTDYSLLLSSQTEPFRFEVNKNIEIKQDCDIVTPTKLYSKNGSTIKDCGRLFIKHSAKGTSFRGITFDGQWKNDICLWIMASDIEIANCNFLHHKGDNVYVVYLGRMQDGYNENIKIHGCFFDGMESVTDGVGKGKGFNAAISSASSYHNIEIYDCTFRNQTGEDDGEGINIAGDILDNDTPWPNMDDDNTLRYGDLNAKIHHNKFYDMTVSAIKVFGKGVDIYDNYIHNTTWNSERGGKSLIRVLEAESVNVTGNTIVSTIDASCFLVMNSANVMFKDNTFTCGTREDRCLTTGSAYFKFQNVKDVVVENVEANIRQGHVTKNTSVFNIMGGDNVTVRNCNVEIDNTDCLYQALTGNTYGDMFLENCTFNVTSSCARWIYVNTKQYNNAKIRISNVDVKLPDVLPPGFKRGSIGTLPYETRGLKVNGQVKNSVNETY